LRREDARAGAVKDKAQHKHRREEALEAYDRALALKPYNGGSLNGKVWTLSKLPL
jgi:hypothetical protein